MAFTNEPSDFTPVDLFGTLAVNAAVTTLACKGNYGSLRITPFKTNNPTLDGFLDLRFLGGVGGALVAQMSDNPTTRRYGHDAAVGLLSSYVATETCRMHAETMSRATTAQAQIAMTPDAVPAAAAPAAAPGSGNYAYGW